MNEENIQLDIDTGMMHLITTIRKDNINCPYCRSVLQDLGNSCPLCNTPHHRNCWSEHGGCSVYGCYREAPRRKSKWLTWIIVAAVFAFMLACIMFAAVILKDVLPVGLILFFGGLVLMGSFAAMALPVIVVFVGIKILSWLYALYRRMVSAQSTPSY
jgi:hypothetical protein